MAGLYSKEKEAGSVRARKAMRIRWKNNGRQNLSIKRGKFDLRDVQS
ncbi:MAG: hypothetical protein ABR911_12980 [Syntrophales bacterium]